MFGFPLPTILDTSPAGIILNLTASKIKGIEKYESDTIGTYTKAEIKDGYFVVYLTDEFQDYEKHEVT